MMLKIIQVELPSLVVVKLYNQGQAKLYFFQQRGLIIIAVKLLKRVLNILQQIIYIPITQEIYHYLV